MKLLIVDDEQAISWGLHQLGEQLGHTVKTASSAEEGLALAADFSPDMVVLDIRLPRMDGLTAIRHFRGHIGAAPIIVITAHGDLNTAVEAVRLGAFEYIIKPFDLTQMKAVIERAARTIRQVEADGSANQESAGGQPGVAHTATSTQMVGKTAVMQEAFRRIALVAPSDACTLISGESGTGKDIAARVIHQHSLRSEGRFVAVNVAALSESLAESELFGHVRGAFTGASEDRMGLIQRANRGTLFLDEVADIPLSTQAKLLRVLEQREVYAVGSNEPQAVDFRMISATHRNLPSMVEEGKFRHDLYFRLCAFEINLPPLRQRPDDIPLLVEHFLKSIATEGAPLALTPEALQVLRERPWYGNVRELRNTIEHAMVLARDSIILPEHLPAAAPVEMAGSRDEGMPLEQQLAVLIRRWANSHLESSEYAGTLHQELLNLVETPLFEAALQHYHGQYATAARALGIHRTTLKKKVDE